MIGTLQCRAAIEYNASRDWRSIENDVIGINCDLIKITMTALTAKTTDTLSNKYQ